MGYIYINDELTAVENAAIPVDDRSFRYGDSIFETIAIHSAHPYLWELHRRRLQDSCSRLSLPLAPEQIASLQNRIYELIGRNNVSDGIARIQVSAGSGGRGYARDDNISPLIVTEVTAYSFPHLQQGNNPVKLWLSNYRKISPHALPVACKLGNGLNSTLSLQQAREHDCGDSLLLGDMAQICEATASNIFWEKDGILFTPDPGCGILDGVMRRRLIELAPLMIKSGRYFMDDILQADAVILTSSIKKIIPVSRLLPYGISFDSKPLAQRLNDIINADIKNHINHINHTGRYG